MDERKELTPHTSFSKFAKDYCGRDFNTVWASKKEIDTHSIGHWLFVAMSGKSMDYAKKCKREISLNK